MGTESNGGRNDRKGEWKMRRFLIALVLVTVAATAFPAHAFASCVATNPGPSTCSFPTLSGSPAGFYLAFGSGSWSVSVTGYGTIASGTGPGFGPVPCPASVTVTANALTPVTAVVAVCFP